jgi:hypothetical protein
MQVILLKLSRIINEQEMHALASSNHPTKGEIRFGNCDPYS